MGSDPKNLQAIMEAPSLSGKVITALPNDGLNDFIQSVILNDEPKHTKEPFYVLHLGVLASLMDKWIQSLPEIRPFYAVKCNPDPNLLAAMAALGSGFDCGSLAEIESVLALGVSPDRIIFSHPCKMESHIKYAATVGVNLTTFDSVAEVEKIREWHPKSTLLIRLKSPEDAQARRPAAKDSKFGALPEELVPLLQAARSAQLPVIGVSFHVGTAVKNYRAYAAAIEAAKTAFETAARLRMPQMRVLNIGGGFTAGQGFEEAASTVRAAIKTCFPNMTALGLSLMAEPGRFFAESAFTLVTNVTGKRIRGEVREYWINDGAHGTLTREVVLGLGNGNLSTCVPLAASRTCKKVFNSTVYGPTCNSLDVVLKDHWLPEIEIDDWLIFSNMGAYSSACKSNFNGFKTSPFSTYLVTYDKCFTSAK